ncbi:MAG: hypothetical protein JF609_11955 [Verrucomicrobia bacterium]|nr:hypothetical protein [Verrucomicrobiota bacterium]
MKNIAHIMLLVGVAGQLAVNAQTDTTVTNQPADAATNAPAAITADATNAPTAPVVAATDTNAAPAMSTNVVAAAAATNAPMAAATEPATTNSAPASTTNATMAATAPAAPASIPLIQFSDVPITTAIENLARQANINYMLDPKIGYGLPDANGQVKVEPQLSIRWENISAENALIALLDNYGLQLIRDKKTGIDRVTMKDPTAPPPLITRVIQLQYAGVTNMTESAQASLTDKRSKVFPDSRTSQMIVVATEPEQAAIDTLIKQLDTPTNREHCERSYSGNGFS